MTRELVLVAETVCANKNNFKTVSVDDIINDMVLYPGKTMYEVLHPSNNQWIKPYFDIDDKSCSITRDTIYDSIIEFLNSIFNSKTNDWAICDDSRPSKSSFHLTLPTHKTTISDMIDTLERCVS